MPKIVKTKIGTPGLRSCRVIDLRQTALPEVSTISGREQQTFHARLRMIAEVIDDHRNQVGRNRHVTRASTRLRSPDHSARRALAVVVSLLMHPRHAAP